MTSIKDSLSVCIAFNHSVFRHCCYIIVDCLFLKFLIVDRNVIITVNSEIFVRILFSRIALKHIFEMLKIRDKGVMYLYQ